MFSSLFSFSEDSPFYILDWYQRRLDDGIPEHLIGFGDCPFGSTYYFDYSVLTNNEPRIINIGELWEEIAEEGQTAAIGYEPIEVVDNFESFLKSLTSLGDD
ncbi:hypothetical protein FHS18_003424 [Paenibacillus phyllosphaerae]|uniref:Knr4/Smi1-like domain-containing protein n=2 Tax=Paenibacillus phyllosphaerae TaxID=274593 RepID=A0A7W5FNH6_9BACL|nr:hypothetical protein [Paenibacillus phyllosphaerae]